MEDTVEHSIVHDVENPLKWTVKFKSHNNALIKSYILIEVIEEDDGDASVCVLRRVNVGYSALQKIMDTLVRNLDDYADMPRLIPVSSHGQPPVGQPSQQS